MIFQTAQDSRLAEAGFRIVQNGYTSTLTITARTIALSTPVILATATDFLPSSVATATSGRNYVTRPATSTSIVNNLLIGLLSKGVGTKAYLDVGEIGLAQCYGVFYGAVVHRATAGASVGQPLIPNSLQDLIPVGGPVTAAATGTAGHVEVPALGGLAILMEALATSSATEQAAARVLLRCM